MKILWTHVEREREREREKERERVKQKMKSEAPYVLLSLKQIKNK